MERRLKSPEDMEKGEVYRFAYRTHLGGKMVVKKGIYRGMGISHKTLWFNFTIARDGKGYDIFYEYSSLVDVVREFRP